MRQSAEESIGPRQFSWAIGFGPVLAFGPQRSARIEPKNRVSTKREFPMSNLYEQIGGNKAVKAAVDVFYQKVLADDRIKHFFDTVDMKTQAGKQAKFLAYAFGGPLKYDGLDMRKAHEHLDLNEEHFTAVAENLQSTLQEIGVAQELIDQVMAIAASTHDDVLGL